MISKDKFIVTWKKFHQAILLFCFVFIKSQKAITSPSFPQRYLPNATQENFSEFYASEE